MNAPPVICGWVILWDDEALIGGRRERFAPFAFSEPLSARMVVSHDQRPGAVLARSSSLVLEQTEIGLKFCARLDGSADARRAAAAVRSGALACCSFEFHSREVHDEGDGLTVVRARLAEISLTGSPAYAGGGCWMSDASELPDGLEALRDMWEEAARQPARRAAEHQAELRRGYPGGGYR
jgi:HK97 family phage prohead protease